MTRMSDSEEQVSLLCIWTNFSTPISLSEKGAELRNHRFRMVSLTSTLSLFLLLTIQSLVAQNSNFSTNIPYYSLEKATQTPSFPKDTLIRKTFSLPPKPTLPREMENIIEQVDESHENTPDVLAQTTALLEKIEYLKAHPIDLNRAQRADLFELPDITDFQITQFLLFRHRHGGRIESIYDLKLIPSWDEELIFRLLPLVTLSPVSYSFDVPTELTGYLLYGHSRPQQPNHYIGDNNLLRTGILLKKSKQTQAGFLFKKGIGERYFVHGQLHQPQQINFFYRTELSRQGIATLILGDYKVQFGTGLICNQNLFSHLSYSSSTRLPVRNRIMRHYSAAEDGWQRGLAIQGSNTSGSIQYIFFLSHRPINALLNRIQGITSIDYSGQVRTSEQENRWHSARQQSAGGRFAYHTPLWTIGVNGIAHGWSGKKLSYLPGYQSLAPNEGIKWFGNLSTDYFLSSPTGKWQWGGEIALDKSGGWGMIHALSFQTTNNGSALLQGRYLSDSYQAPSGRAPSRFARLGNEKGATLQLQYPISSQWTLSALVDLHAGTLPKNLKREGYRLIVSTQFNLLSHWVLKGRIAEINGRYNNRKRHAKISCSYRQDLFSATLYYSVRQSRLPNRTQTGHLIGLYGQYLVENLLPQRSVRLEIKGGLYLFDTPNGGIKQYPYLQYVTYGSNFFSVYGRGVLSHILVGFHHKKKWRCQLQWTQLYPQGYQIGINAFPNQRTLLQLYLEYTL